MNTPQNIPRPATVQTFTPQRWKSSACIVSLAASLLAGRAGAGEIPERIRFLNYSGRLDVKMEVNSGLDLNLEFEPMSWDKPLGQILSTHQMWKLDQVRAKAPDRFRLLQTLFPLQIAEYFLRRGFESSSATPGAVASQEGDLRGIAVEIVRQYVTQPVPAGLSDAQLATRRQILAAVAEKLPPGHPSRALLDNCANVADPNFGTLEKTRVFSALKNQYDPYRTVRTSIVGNTLLINGRIDTDRLAAAAAVAGQSVEAYARSRGEAVGRDLAEWRAGQISGDAYAGTIKSFLNDARLAAFNADEIRRAYARIFGRDLKTDAEADRVAAKEGHPVTYAQLAGSR